MKYNSTITVLNYGGSGTLAKWKGWKTLILVTLLLVTASVGYWQYLQHLTHVGGPLIFRTARAARPTVKTLPETVPAAPVVSAVPMVQSPPPAAVVKPLVPEAATVPTVSEAVATTVPVPLPVAKSVLVKAASVSMVAQRQASAGQALPRFTEANPLLQAGRQAFGNLVDTARMYPDAYGFKQDDSIKNARLGDPIPVHQIAEQDRSRYQAGQPVKSLLKPANRWVFPVLMGDEVRCMVQVTRTGRTYVPGSGSKMLGLAWNKILTKWPASEGFHPQLLIHPDIPGYYFTVPELAEQNITDICEMVFFKGDLSPANVILASWR